jgi:hypothetical protein
VAPEAVQAPAPGHEREEDAEDDGQGPGRGRVVPGREPGGQRQGDQEEGFGQSCIREEQEEALLAR